jgi:outer membrane protein assembly factor BamA
MVTLSSRLFLLLALLTGLPPVPGSSAIAAATLQLPDSAHRLVAVKITGSTRYQQSDVIAASGLQMGSSVTDDDFKRASRHLADTGAFSDIAYTFSFSSAGTKLEFQLTDAGKFLPARFEDFVWFTDAELLQRIREHVPLFKGDLPLSGRLPDEVSDVLQAMLVEKGIPGNVAYQRFAPEGGPVESINYRVSEVLIRVHDVEFTGAGVPELPLLQSAAERMPDREYSRSRFNQFIERQLLPIFHSRGYLKVSFGVPQPKVVKLPTAENDEESRRQTFVDVVLTVNPGPQYQLSRLDWSGNHEISTETLQSLITAKAGQPANTVRINDGLEQVKTLYGSRGFINVSIKPGTEFDDAAGTVAIHLDVKEGAVYHMGELAFRGLDNNLTAKLAAAWKLRPGDVYDATYLKQYLPEANRLLPPSLDWEAAPHVTANLRDKTVDVDLQYTAKAPR